MNQEKQDRGARGGGACGWKPLQPAGGDACPTLFLRETKEGMFAA